ADAANLSQEGKLNILGVFDALQVATLPAVHPRAHLVVHLKGTQLDVGTHTVTLRWINPHGSELWTSTGELNVGAPPPGISEMDHAPAAECNRDVRDVPVGPIRKEEQVACTRGE